MDSTSTRQAATSMFEISGLGSRASKGPDTLKPLSKVKNHVTRASAGVMATVVGLAGASESCRWDGVTKVDADKD